MAQKKSTKTPTVSNGTRKAAKAARAAAQAEREARNREILAALDPAGVFSVSAKGTYRRPSAARRAQGRAHDLAVQARADAWAADRAKALRQAEAKAKAVEARKGATKVAAASQKGGSK